MRPIYFLFALLLSTSMLFAQSDAAFEQFKTDFFKRYWQLNPGYAASLGLTDYAGILIVPTPTQIQEEVKAYKELHKKLHRFEPTKLSPINQTDFALLDNQLQSAIWYATTFKSYEWDPSNYNVGGLFDIILTNEDIDLPKRIQHVYTMLEQVPAYYEAAQKNIDRPTLEHTELAILQQKGALSIFEKDIPAAYAKVQATMSDKAVVSKKDFDWRLRQATTAVTQYGRWLEKELLPTIQEEKNRRSFRIGKELYDQKFKYDIQSGYTAEQIYQKAVNEKKQLHAKMIAITQTLWPKYFGETAMPANSLVAIKTMIERLSLQHVHRDSFIIAVREQLPKLEAFIRSKDIVYLDPNKPLQVRETPEYMRGVAGASISSPGVFEKSRPTYYNVTPLDEYSEEQAESYLREYNHYMLQILNIHEAIPGHYVQLVYSNQSPSLVKSIFGNGAMVEGWACYTERMMLEEGYGAEEQPELWLMYYKWNLRIACNTILDYGVQVLNNSEQQVLDLLIKEAFQEETEAREKWQRAQLTQVQLCSYYTGLTEIYDFREEMKQRLGNGFNLRAFHEKFLSYGSAPVPEIRKLMLNTN